MSANAPGAAGNGSRTQRRFLYQHISEQVLSQIRSGTLRVGERLPSVRKMSRYFGCSVNTVIQSYRHLEAEGYVRARPQSGFYVRAASLGKSADQNAPRFPLLPVEVSLSEEIYHYMNMRSDGRRVNLGVALPSRRLMPVRRLQRTMADVVQENPDRAWGYTHIVGFAPLLQQLAQRTLTYDVPAGVNDIVVTNGTMEALTLAIRAVSRPGDAIAVESPTYYGSLLMLEAHGRRVIEIPTDERTGIRLDSLEKSFRSGRVTACLFSANAQNPLGFVMPEAAKREIVRLSARYSVPLIENDVWGDTVYEPATDSGRPTPAKAYDERGLVLYCNSFSKTLSPGLRLGWCIPGRFQKRVQELKQLSTICAASASQLTVGQFLENGLYDLHVLDLRRGLRDQTADYIETVRRHFPTGTEIVSPDGGCALWIRLPAGGDYTGFFRRASEANILIFPGRAFSADERYRNCLRISTGAPLSTPQQKAIETLGRLVGESL
ncbi:PLP-dependent aminotransferase family protein [Ectothiorhodospiraceae bacterium WFHF3C12]|nr:PLP-dependent aminotransferase family protein [Ectothiorhodospiraceae bacterium WFHF3C12]